MENAAQNFSLICESCVYVHVDVMTACQHVAVGVKTAMHWNRNSICVSRCYHFYPSLYLKCLKARFITSWMSPSKRGWRGIWIERKICTLFWIHSVTCMVGNEQLIKTMCPKCWCYVVYVWWVLYFLESMTWSRICKCFCFNAVTFSHKWSEKCCIWTTDVKEVFNQRRAC